MSIKARLARLEKTFEARAREPVVVFWDSADMDLLRHHPERLPADKKALVEAERSGDLVVIAERVNNARDEGRAP
jgi:hypothetical protein